MALHSDLVERCIDAAGNLRWAYQGECPPFSLQRLLEHFGVAEVRMKLLDRDARLVRRDGRILIEVNSLFPAVRRRLSIAHEIAHIILNEAAGRDRYAVSHGDPSEEALCNLIGGQLLSPDWAIRDHLEENPDLAEWRDAIRCRTILSGASRFGISVDLMARRMMQDLDLAPAKVAIVLRYRESALRVSSSWHARRERRFVPLHKRAPESSVLLRAYESGGMHRATERLQFGSLKGDFVVEAVGFGSARSSETTPKAVLAVLTPS